MNRLALKRRLAGVVRRVANEIRIRLSSMRPRHAENLIWIPEGAVEFRASRKSVYLKTDTSDWGYQVKTAPINVPQGFWAVVTLKGNLKSGAVCIGLLDAAGATWIDTRTLLAGSLDQQFVIDIQGMNETTIVFSNAQGGQSVLELDCITLTWLPERLAIGLVDTQASINNEIESLITTANPVPFGLGGGGIPSPGNMVEGVGVYLRTDYWVKINAGGSYGHTCYVANELAKSTRRLVCFMANRFDMLDDFGIEQIMMDVPFATCNEIDVLRASRFYYVWLRDRISALQPAYIYERAILGSYVGARLSQEFGIPYILEYNGSEISMKRSFDDAGYELEESFMLSEKVAFSQATSIVAISEIIADGLIKQGVDPDKILINPNGCSPDHYRPLNEGEKRQRISELGWSDEHCIVGFIGTFGGWHGVDVLAASLQAICQKDNRIRFLLIGDGNFRYLIDDAVKKFNLGERVRVTGIVPQAEAAKLLACSDILVAPHSRHMVDSRFFGSPTKLFEYMSLGGAIVASRLEQIGEVLTPSLSASELSNASPQDAEGKLAVLCEPGNVSDFVDAVVGLAQRPEIRSVLGRNARKALIDGYTWEQHVNKIWAHVVARSARMIQ